MKRRGFLETSITLVTPAIMSSPALASSGNKRHNMDFERLITDFYTGLPDNSEDLRDVLEEVANAIHQKGQKIGWPVIESALSSIGDAKTVTRRTQFVVKILHNNDLGNYIDEAWVATARNRLKVVTRFLPFITSFNNLYAHAKKLDNAVKKKPNVEDEKYETFSYALLAFAIELGFFYSGTAYKMAWRGTRFVSNRTLLRVGQHLDNKLIALVMSEIHWKIREKLYEKVNSDNLKSIGRFTASADHLGYLIEEIKDLKSFAESEEVEDSYLKNVNLDIDYKTLRQWELKELSKRESENGNSGIW